MAFRTQQRLLFVLTVDLYERLTDASQVLHGGQVAIDRNPRSSGFRDKSAHHEFALRPIPIRKPLQRRLPFQLKNRFDRRVRLASANHVRGASPAQQ